MKIKSEYRILSYVFLLAIFASLSFLYLFNFSNAYEDKTTHRALTDEIVDFYNLFYEPKITAEQKEWIVQGSMDEDIKPRWMNHYYDPIYNEGWQGEKSGYLPNWFVRGGAGVTITDEEPVSSLDWLRNQELQTLYKGFGGNRTWDRALYEMAKTNNEREAYYTLGFVLHLMEDAAVPDHTRNDSHAPGIGGDEGSPYEQYADRFTRDNFNVAADLRNAGYKPVERNTVGYYLHSLALYSNKNFFSKDTIFDKKYEEPKVVKEDNDYGYGIDSFNNKFKLVFIDKHWDNIKYQYVNVYRLGNKNEPIILDNYFTLLSRQAITNGAGVINLFHKEAEKAKKNPENLIPPPELKTANRAVSLFSEIDRNGVYKGVADTFEKAMKKYVIYKPINFTFNLAASVLDAFDEIDTKKLATGFFSDQQVGDIIEKTSSIIKDELKNAAEIIKNIDPAVLEAGIIAKESVKESVVVSGQNIQDPASTNIPPTEIAPAEILRKETEEAKETSVKNEPVESDDKPKENNIPPAVLVKERSLEFFIASIGNDSPSPVETESELEPEEPESNPEDDDSDGDDGSDENKYGDNNNDNDDDKDKDDEEEEEEEAPEDTTPPITPFDINIANGNLFTATDDVSTADGTQIIISGKGEPTSAIIISVNPVYETEVATNETWQKEITLNEGANEIKIKSKDAANNESEEIIVNVVLDSVGPISQIKITNYNLMSLTFNVEWLATEEDVATTTYEPQYRIGENGEWQNLEMENGGKFEATQDKTTYYFRVHVRDVNGNQGDWSEIAEAEINTKPVIFNEIAWMGTEFRAQDEWIELYNASGQDIDLRNWKIEVKNGTPNFVIDNATTTPIIILSNGYFLLERTDDETISNIDADFIYTGALSDSSKILRLKDSNNNVIDELNSWHAGDKTAKRTMERVRSDIGSDISANWLTYEDEGGEAQDADANPILGTPKSQNSVHNKHYAISGNISKDTTFYKSKSPYFIYGKDTTLNVSKGVTLTIEPGVKILVDDNVQIDISGTLKSQGTKSERIIFTSSKDESEVAAGDWEKLYFLSDSVNSELSYTDILYGGKWRGGFGGESAAVEVATSTVSFNNVLVGESELRGIWLRNSSSIITDSVFDNINYKNGSAMIEINGGNPKIKNSVFKNTNYGINIINGVNPIISGNSFSDTNYPIQVVAADPVFSDNIASGNSHDAIYLIGDQYKIKTNTTLEKDLPYLIDSIISVQNGAVLTVNPGVEIRFGYDSGLEIENGKLIAVGSPDEKIIFTNDNGAWKWIYFTGGASADSELKYVTIENGGKGTSLNGAMVKIENVAISIDNAEIRNSATRGILLINSDSVITDSLFECNASNFEVCGGGKSTNVAALDIQSSEPIISDSIFKLNRIGIKADTDSNPTFENIVFGEGSEVNSVDTDPPELIP